MRVPLPLSLFFCACFVGCGSMGASVVRYGPASLTGAEVQSELMSFADTYMGVMNEAWNRAVPRTPAGDASPAERAAHANARRLSHVRRLATVSSALSIASSPNPLVGLADMIAMVSLERRGLVAASVAGGTPTFGVEGTKELIRIYSEQERYLLEVGGRAMNESQIAELSKCIDDWVAENPDQRYVTTIRLKDAAGRRQQSESARRANNLLTSLGLDPLASLDPAAQELQQSRLLAERVFFYASRAPTLLRWQCELALANIVREPAIQQSIDSMASMSTAAHRVSLAVEQLPDHIDVQRKAAMTEFFGGLTAQRESLVEDLGRSQADLQATLRDLRATIDASDRLAASVNTTLTTARALAERVVASPDVPSTEPGNEPDAIESYQAAALQTAKTAEGLTELTKRIEQLLTSPAWNQPGSAMQAVVAEMEASSERMMDRAFYRLLVLAIAAPCVALVAALVYRRLVRERRTA